MTLYLGHYLSAGDEIMSYLRKLKLKLLNAIPNYALCKNGSLKRYRSRHKSNTNQTAIKPCRAFWHHYIKHGVRHLLIQII
jgi:hypothetical protein